MSDASNARGDGDCAIATSQLSKRFRSGQLAVDAIDLRVPRGAIYGFIGPNGSGKTTTIRMLLGLVGATSGTATLLGGQMPDAGPTVLPRVGTLVEGPAFHPYLSGQANLERMDAADATSDPRTSKKRISAALDRVGLGAAARKNYRQYSLGMKQRLGLASALLTTRDLLVLDEPTNGLDPQGTREVRTLLREVADGGATVLVSSHLLGEIEQVCTDIGIMSRGRLVAQGARTDLVQRGESTIAVTTSAQCVDATGTLLADLGVGRLRREGMTFVGALDSIEPQRISAAVVGAGLDLVGLEVRHPSLETMFVELTGEGFDVAR